MTTDSSQPLKPYLILKVVIIQCFFFSHDTVTYVHNWSWVTGPEESYTVGLDLDVTTCSGSQAFSQMSLLVSRVSENEQHLTEAPFTLKSLCRWEEHTLTVGTCGQMCLYSESLLASWLWTSGHVVSLLIDAERPLPFYYTHIFVMVWMSPPAYA